MGKLICAVLRGLEGGNALRLLDLGGSNAHPATQLIDFVAVLFGYAVSCERTLEAF
jgi:hypothetical protein